jgi:hypothetical protein
VDGELEWSSSSWWRRRGGSSSWWRVVVAHFIKADYGAPLLAVVREE